MRVSRLRLRFRTHDTQSRSAPLLAMNPDRRRRRLVEAISFAFRDGNWHAPSMAARAAHDLGVELTPWLHALAAEVVDVLPDHQREPSRELSAIVERAVRGDELPPPRWMADWADGTVRRGNEPWSGPLHTVPAEMGARRWRVPGIVTPPELADFLGVDSNHLEWYADVRSLERSAADENLRHYDYHWRSKQTGGARLVEAPKQNLKYLQRRILRQILDEVPPHDAAHGFRPGHSIQTFAAPHTGRQLVLRFDLRSFFTSVPVGRIFATYEAIGYPDEVAHLLTGLATNSTPGEVLAAYRSNRRLDATTAAMLRGPHLPQGAPTSPALANLAAFALDVRMSALAARFEATYTRYADDLAVSGDDEFVRGATRFFQLANTIVRDEGFAVHPRKTRWQRRHQRQMLTGMVVNSHLNLQRGELDLLRAQLHEAIHRGPAVANRMGRPHYRSYLEGRIGFVQATNPAKARKLWRMFDRVSW